MGISTHIPFPKFRFRKLYNKKKKPEQREKETLLFSTDVLLISIDLISAEKLFVYCQSLNVDVVLPPQWCCGLPRAR